MNAIRDGMKSVFGVVVKGQTYANIVYVLLAFPLGTAYFIFLVTGLSVGLGTVVVWVGLPILVIVLAGSWALAAFERRMTTVMLQQDIGPMSGEAQETGLGLWQRLKAHLGNQVTWTSMLYLLLKFPVGTFTFTVTVTLLATSLGLVFAPLIYQVSSPGVFTLWNGTTLTFWPVDSIGEAWLFTIGGLALLVLSLHIINAMARWSGQLARATLEKSQDRRDERQLSSVR